MPKKQECRTMRAGQVFHLPLKRDSKRKTARSIRQESAGHRLDGRKGKASDPQEGNAATVNRDGRQAIADLIAWHRERYRTRRAHRPLFPSRNRSGAIAMNRQTAHEILKKAFTAAGLNGKLATHSLRKSFAQRLYEESSDIYLVQELLGHKSVATTQKSLGVNYQSARQACERMAVSRQHDRNFDFSLKTLYTISIYGLGYATFGHSD